MRLTVLTAAAVLAATTAVALPPLKDDPRIQREFLAGAIADTIRRHCPTMSGRLLRALGRKAELERYVAEKGYSKGDIDAMLGDSTAEAWLKAQRDHYLAKNGVTKGDSASYCRLGREEIAKNSLAGWLLREN